MVKKIEPLNWDIFSLVHPYRTLEKNIKKLKGLVPYTIKVCRIESKETNVELHAPGKMESFHYFDKNATNEPWSPPNIAYAIGMLVHSALVVSGYSNTFDVTFEIEDEFKKMDWSGDYGDYLLDRKGRKLPPIK